MENSWYRVANEAELDSPSLLIYKERVQHNIEQMLQMVEGPERLINHVKTNKMPKVVEMMLQANIQKFKTATIAEAEMVAMAGGKYILIAHQLVGPKIDRLIRLKQQYPEVFFASLVDCKEVASQHNQAYAQAEIQGNVFLDVNNGMNRSGHPLNEEIFPLYKFIQAQSYLNCEGLHIYDGHLRDENFKIRQGKIDEGFMGVEQLVKQIEQAALPRPMVIAGGTPAFTSHVLRSEVYCSPGTCLLWDWCYGDRLQEQDFEYAALVLTRVISKPAPGILSIDMGHKAIAAENPIQQRIRFLNLDRYELISQSEEHGVLQVSNWNEWQVGDVLYGVPFHVCPTVNLYDEAYVVAQNRVQETWQVLGRRRRITI